MCHNFKACWDLSKVGSIECVELLWFGLLFFFPPSVSRLEASEVEACFRIFPGNYKNDETSLRVTFGDLEVVCYSIS